MLIAARFNGFCRLPSTVPGLDMLTKGSILLADDDPDDRLMATEAAEETGMDSILVTVDDGEQLLQHLFDIVDGDGSADLPALILLDLNMPRMNGKEALAKIRSDARLRRLPVVVLTTSSAEEDIQSTYDLGVNSFITKPDTYGGLVEVMQSLRTYWFNTVELPRPA